MARILNPIDCFTKLGTCGAEIARETSIKD